jgi:UDP-glucose:(heptosyl)LPS alpha-1,3-glucosyltransferase
MNALSGAAPNITPGVAPDVAPDVASNIALIRAKYNPFGGAERFLNDAVAALAGPETKFTLFTREWPVQNQSQLSHRIVNPRHLTSYGRERGFAHAVAKVLGQEKFDLVQSYERMPCCDVYHAVDGVHAQWLVQRHRVSGSGKIIGVAMNPRHHLVLRAERAMYTSPQFKAAICISEMVKKDILRHFPIDEKKLHVIYSGVDCNHFTPESRDSLRASTRQALGIPADVPTALFVGSGFERKGLTQFLRALATSPEQAGVVGGAEKCWGIVVGKDKHLSRYQELAKKLGIGARVVFTGGVTDTRPHYAAADVFVLPTLYEPFGLVCLEAMAAGLPVVTTSAAGAAELIVSGVTGYVTDALDTAAIAKAIFDACGKPFMSFAARETALTFTRERMSAQYRELYRELLGR